ncbi:MAG: bacteriohopanetetrol glucosamine biosynthesis glycosyltransferase HpnI [Rhodospirillaceae bacterium]|nr:bacteriohopanetetrol glucosamine biosynthesis glycosyltransferase HpnI [Rhodospirillaceae bacterium]
MSTALDVVVVMLLCGSVAGACYLVVATFAVRSFASGRADPRRLARPVSVLKPVCGLEPGLYENLRSFCEQNHPGVQTVFAARDADDPAIGVVRRLQRDLPEADITLVAGRAPRATNFKVANLMRAAEVARHDVLVISDSDMRVGPDYLGAVTAPLADPEVGLVTCLYVGRPCGNLWSMLGAMFINYEFLPAVLVGRLTGAGDGCFGATIALRRETLERVGGFAAFRNRLADDYALGEAVRRLGRKVVLSSYLVDDIVYEPHLRTLFLHELRWARTIRAITPVKYAASAITRPVGLAVIAALLAGFTPETLWAMALALGCRALMIGVMNRTLALKAPPLWLVPARELLSLAVLLLSFFGSRVTWRGTDFQAGPDGELLPAEGGREIVAEPEPYGGGRLGPFARGLPDDEDGLAQPDLVEPLEGLYRRS